MLHPAAKLSIWAHKDRGWASHAVNPTVVPCLTGTGITVPKQLLPQTAREQLKGTQARHGHKKRQLIISSWEADCKTASSHPFNHHEMGLEIFHLTSLNCSFPHLLWGRETVSDANTICWIYGCKALGERRVWWRAYLPHKIISNLEQFPTPYWQASPTESSFLPIFRSARLSQGLQEHPLLS